MMKLFEPNVIKMEAKKDVNGLVNALGHKEPSVRKAVVKALGNIQDKQIIILLIEILNDEYWSDRNPLAIASVAEVLGNLKDKRAVEPLIAAMKKGRFHGWCYYDAIMALGKIGGQIAIEHIIQYLVHEGDYQNRYWAVKALGETGDAKAVQPLIEALQDSYGEVGTAAINSLVKIGQPAIEPLIKALKNENDFIQRGAILALSQIKDARAIQPLVQALRDKKSHTVRWEAHIALEKFHWVPKNDTEKAYFLIAQEKWLGVVTPLDGGPSGWAYSANTVEKFKNIGEPAVYPLIEALKYEDKDARGGAAYALGGIKDARAVQPLIDALRDPNDEVRGVAAYSLGEMGDARAIEPLKQLLEDSVNLVRETSARALEKIKMEK